MPQRSPPGAAITASRASAQDYAPDYFAAFVVDPDGYRLEALRLGA